MTQEVKNLIVETLEEKRVKLFEARKGKRKDDRRYVQLTESIEQLQQKRTQHKKR